MEKHKDDREQVRRISSTELAKDHWSYMERQGIKCGSTSTNRTETTTGHRIGERRFRFAGHVMRMAYQNAQPAAQLIGYQLTAEEEEVDHRKPW